jgi:hypothetical protein
MSIFFLLEMACVLNKEHKEKALIWSNSFKFENCGRYTTYGI